MNSIDIVYLDSNHLGIENTLVCMGYFQERIVTRSYAQSSSQNVATGGGPLLDRFEDTQFLVLANRFMALILSGLYMAWTWRSQPVHSPPFYLHAFSSLSNVIARYSYYIIAHCKHTNSLA
jgi:hypothetical protein